MLENWYFCCCIKASPSSTCTFLSILETLENPESDSQLLYLAYSELQQIDLWMQIYALPYVLKSLKHPNLLANKRIDTISLYLDSLLETLPGKELINLKRLAQKLPGRLSGQEILDAARETYRYYQAHRYNYKASQTPYLDLKVFLPEIIILTIFLDKISSKSDLFDSLSVQLENKEGEVSQLLEACLDYECGRLPFILSVSIARLTGFQSLEELTERFWLLGNNQSFCVLSLEPDLLKSYAYNIYFNKTKKRSSGKSNPTDTAYQNIQEELTSLKHLSQLLDKSSESVEPVYRVGFEENLKLQETLSVVYWQCTLWEVGTEENVNEIDKILRNVWGIPRKVNENIEIQYPANQEIEPLQQRLDSLLALREQRPQINWVKSTDFCIPKHHQWLFVSPWVERDDRKWQPKNRCRYKTALSSGNLIRLVVGLGIAIKVLQTLKLTSSERNPYRQFIIHASDVVYKVFGRWLKTYSDQQKADNISLTLPLTGLTLFAKRQVQLVGPGHLHSICPESFVQILRDAQSNIVQNSIEQNFLDLVCPEVLMSWIIDAYPSAIRGKNSARWLSLIQEVYDFFNSGKHLVSIRQGAALVVRFLSTLDDDPIFDWRKKDKAKDKAHHRLLLLSSQDVTVTEWQAWDEYEKHLDSSFQQSSRIVRTLQQLQTLAKEYLNKDAVPLIYKSWLSEWRHCLNAVNKRVGLDRFTRLLLLELLENPLLQDSDDQNQIAYVLLEYGCTYDLQRLLEYAFPTSSSHEFGESIDKKYDLQATLISAMQSFLEEQNKNFASGRDLRVAKDPKITRIDFQKAELFQATLETVTYLCSCSRRNEKLAHFCKKSAQISLQIKCRNQKSMRYSQYAIEIRNGVKQVIFHPQKEDIPDVFCKAISYDPNSFIANILHEDFDTKGIKNFFGKSLEVRAKNDHRSGSSLQELKILAITIKKEPAGHDSDRPLYCYTFNCGLDKHYEYLSTKRLGHYVALTLKSKSGSETLDWYVDSAKPLSPRLKRGDVKKISVSTRVKNGTQSGLILHEDGNECQNYDPIDWESNIAWIFQHGELKSTEDAYAQLGHDRNWRPYDWQFFDLILDACNAFPSQASAKPITLCFVNEDINLFGHEAWRFSTTPGKNYLIEKDKFDKESRNKITRKIKESFERFKYADGLLIALSPKFFDDCQGRVHLELAQPLPFDSRNLEWRALLDNFQSEANEVFLAERSSDNNWYCSLEELAISGFPEKVRVSFLKPVQLDREKIEFTIQEWNPNKAEVKAEPIESYEIRPKDDWLDFFRRWTSFEASPEETLLELRQGKTISFRNKNSSVLLCFTCDNILIQVEAESLSMNVLQIGDRPTIARPRMAEIVSCRWEEINVVIARENIPSALDYRARHLGVLVSTPQATGNLYRILWSSNQEPVDVQIERPPSNLRPGAVIYASDRSGIFKFRTPLYIRACALWEKKESEGHNLTVQYLGVTQNTREAIAEINPGEFEILDEKKARLVQPRKSTHLAQIEGSKIQGKLEFPLDVENITHGNSWIDKDKQASQRRSILGLGAYDEEYFLIGNCSEDTTAGNLRLKKVKLYLFHRGDNLYALDREFILEEAELQPFKETNHRQFLGKETEHYQNLLEVYWHAPRTLEADFDPVEEIITIPEGKDSLKVPGQTTWTNRVQIAKDEGTYILFQPEERGYSKKAIVRLFKQSDGEILASFRRVDPILLEEFRAYQDIPIDELVYLQSQSIKLYFVGPNPEETAYLFEWGYGKTILVPSERLRFRGEKFKQASLLLFYGDLITAIKLSTVNGREEQTTEISGSDPGNTALQDAQSGYILDIQEIDLQYNQGRAIYEERKRYQIIHLLYVNIPSLISAEASIPEVKIEAVYGFSEFSKNPRKFQRLEAQLAPSQKLEENLKKLDELLEKNKEPVVFGRLDTQEYERSSGKNLVFHHVTLAFDDENIQHQEWVFLKAGKIRSKLNDKYLEVLPPENLLDMSDVQGGMKRLELKRRQFSVREDILKRISQAKSDNYFEGDWLLVRFIARDINVPYLSLIQDPPCRRDTVLNRIINASANCLVTIARVYGNGALEVELKPGVFFKLPTDLIESQQASLASGDIVQLTTYPYPNRRYKFRVASANLGDAHYLPENTVRPAVALPIDSLRITPSRKVDDLYIDNSIAIGSLPNIKASPGHHQKSQSSWRRLTLKEFIASDGFVRLMSTQHPKLVLLGRHQKQKFVCPLSPEFPYGEADQAGRCFKVNYTNNKSSQEIRYFHLLTFADQSRKELLRRAEEESWTYHDTDSLYWIPGREISKKKKLKPQRGPVFFQRFNDQFRLRYSPDKFRIFGFPVREIIDLLSRKIHKRFTFSVAGISQLEGGGLWLELAPGRLAEVPAPLMVWKHCGLEKSLNHFYWQGFAPGDQVTLQLIRDKKTDDLLRPERIRLVNWKPGPRKVFGNERCFLPVQATNTKVGSLELGSGKYALTLPCSENCSFHTLVALTPINVLLNIGNDASSKSIPRRGDIVFLSLNQAKTRAVVLGFDNLVPEPETSSKYWKDDSPLKFLVSLDNDQWYLNTQRLGCLLNLLATASQEGALPVKVERVKKVNIDSSEYVLYFSLRNHDSAVHLPRGKFSFVRLLGLWPNSQTGLLQCGSGLFVIKISQLVSGLPSRLNHVFIETWMQVNRASVIGIHRTDEGRLETGFQSYPEDEFYVEALCVVSTLQTEDLYEGAGLICRSVETMGLYWLPAEKAALAPLSPAQLESIFVKPRKSFRVKQMGKRYSEVSVLDLQEIGSQFKKLKIGEELSVIVVYDSEPLGDGKSQCLVKIPTTGVILRCLTYGQLLHRGEEILVEVTQRFDGIFRSITVVLSDTKRKVLDFPDAWLKDALPQPGHFSPEFSNFLNWHGEGVPVELDLHSSTHLSSLDRALHIAYFDAFRSSEGTRNSFPRFQYSVAVAGFCQLSVRAQISIVPAFMDILLLNHVGEFDYARQLIKNLGQRARRSLHVDVLLYQWVRKERAGEEGIFQRLHELKKVINSTQTLEHELETIEMIRRFCEAVTLRHNTHEGRALKSISDGLAASVGLNCDLENLSETAEINQDLIKIYNQLYYSGSNYDRALDDIYVNKFKNLLDKVLLQELDLVLLDPIKFSDNVINTNNTKMQSFKVEPNITLEDCRACLEEDKAMLFLLKIFASKLNPYYEVLKSVF